MLLESGEGRRQVARVHEVLLRVFHFDIQIDRIQEARASADLECLRIYLFIACVGRLTVEMELGSLVCLPLAIDFLHRVQIRAV